MPKENDTQGWNLEDIAAEASQKTEDEIYREVRQGDADKQDIAGSSDSKDTPQGREEAKNEVRGKANNND